MEVTQGRGYTSYLSGNAADVKARFRPGLALCGGGADVDEAMSWLLDHGGGGDVLVLRASGEDGYNDYLMELGSVDSVESVVVHNREGAQQPELARKIEQAEVIFLAGGDQGDYLERWRGTPVQEALQQAVERGVPLGGTSAGLALLGDPLFSAPEGEVFTPEVLQDPFRSSVELAPRFLHLPALQDTITDTHFSQRDRLGRLIGFVARAQAEGRNVRGLGVDERTALLLDAETEQVVGNNQVFLVSLSEPPTVCQPGQPLSVANVRVEKRAAGQAAGTVTSVTVENGKIRD